MLKYMSVAISGEPRGPKGKGELGLGTMVGEMAMNARFTVAIKGYSERTGYTHVPGELPAQGSGAARGGRMTEVTVRATETRIRRGCDSHTGCPGGSVKELTWTRTTKAGFLTTAW
jgi:hypothetical protein